MRTETIEIFNFEELTKEIQDKAQRRKTRGMPQLRGTSLVRPTPRAGRKQP